MALVVSTLTEAIKAIRNIDVDNGAIDNDDMARMLAEAIDAYIKSGEVIVVGGGSYSGTVAKVT